MGSGKRWIALAAVSWCAAVCAPEDRDANLAGRVTSAITGAPLVRAHVRVYRFAENGGTYGALTDAAGKYSIAHLPPGNYSITVEAAGFQPPRVVPDAHTDTFHLDGGEWRSGMDIALTPWSAISGRVTDAEGRPVQAVQVSALGIDGFSMEAISDPQGEFRLARLAWGRYRVRAVPEVAHMPPEIRSDGSTEVRYAATYYPSSLTVESAAPLDLAPGAERAGIDIHLVAAPVVAVRGTVSGIAAGIDAAIDVRKVQPPRAPNTGRGLGYGHGVNADGSFEIWGLDPGKYVLTARSNGAGWGSAPVEIVVAGRDVEGVRLELVRQLEIAGRVVAGDERARVPHVPAGAPLGQQAQIVLHEVTSGAQSFSVVSGDGSFHLSRVEPGRYAVGVGWGPYVRSVAWGAAAVDGPVVDLRTGSGDEPMIVSVSSATGEIAGTVRDNAGPVGRARVQLLSEQNASRDWGISAGPDGRFLFPNLAPGKYRLLAWDSDVVWPLAIRYQLIDYADVIETVEVRAGERVTRDLRRHGGK